MQDMAFNAAARLEAGPCCLIYTDSNGQLQVDEEIASELRKVKEDIITVAIAGLYRTGKSYLMNRLAGQTTGFRTSASVKHETQGIWMWLIQHPMHINKKLAILDTEGLGDAQKSDVNHDNLIFIMATLLSSALVLNVMGQLDDKTIHNIFFIGEMVRRVQMELQEKEFFPAFILTVRDFTLDLAKGGKKLNPQEYLEWTLETTETNTPYFIQPREGIKEMFKKRQCFVFDQPVDRSKLEKLHEVPDDELRPGFIKSVISFRQFIYDYPDVKNTSTGRFNGDVMVKMTYDYLRVIQEGAVPKVEDPRRTALRKPIQHLLDLYTKNMKDNLHLPTPDHQTLDRIHRKSEDQAYKALRKEPEKLVRHQLILQKEIRNIYDSFVKENQRKSRKRCREVLKKLEDQVTSDIGPGEMNQNKIVKSYLQQGDLGVEGMQCLQEYSLEKRSHPTESDQSQNAQKIVEKSVEKMGPLLDIAPKEQSAPHVQQDADIQHQEPEENMNKTSFIVSQYQERAPQGFICCCWSSARSNALKKILIIFLNYFCKLFYSKKAWPYSII